ncbi:unnamed protein product [Rotaria sp. Silwood1]|nr:unnamed protein product [Rotaria sp. Silwood1]CAF4849555.1 unnamed protein product [Rotaria sp. Silwood1]
MASSMRPFSIVTDPGFKHILQECLTIGREFRAQGELLIDDLLPSDRTVRNEVDRAAEQGRNILKTKLIAAAEDYRLSISPDICVRRTELTPTKTETTTITTRTLTQASPELSDEEEELRNAAETDDSSDEETDADDEEVDYTAATADDIPVSAKAILDVIKNCKSLVKYVKKANLNRQLQLERIKFFYKRAVQLLDKMFTMEDDYIRASFLHPNYKQLRGATKEQIESCYNFCRDFILPSNTMNDSIRTDENIIQPPAKKLKFMTQLMDKKETAPASADEIDHYIALTVEEEYTDPLVFWRQERNQLTFPTLYRLAKRTFAAPCSSASVERQFSAAGQIITQRRSNLDPSTVNNLIFLRSFENNK